MGGLGDLDPKTPNNPLNPKTPLNPMAPQLS